MIDERNDHPKRLTDIAEKRQFVAMCRRAVLQRDRYARKWIQRATQKPLLECLHNHPFYRELQYRGSDEQYVMQTCECFWQRVDERKLWLSTRSQMLRYLQATLNGVILEALRSTIQQKEVPVHAETYPRGHTLWNIIQDMLPDERERRVAYLLYHCGLKPAEILRTCPQEFNDVQDIHRVRCVVIEKMGAYL